MPKIPFYSRTDGHSSPLFAGAHHGLPACLFASAPVTLACRLAGATGRSLVGSFVRSFRLPRFPLFAACCPFFVPYVAIMRWTLACCLHPSVFVFCCIFVYSRRDHACMRFRIIK
ncbi:unnamed protein product [Laminaria digitata]